MSEWLQISNKQFKFVLLTMSKDMEQDIVLIREWLSKEDFLPQDFDDMMIKKFLHSCYGSLEQTKKCIEKFCTSRSNLIEMYTDRDPTSKKLKTAFSITSISTYMAGNNELLIHQLDDPYLENFEFYDVLKSFLIQADYWLQKVPNFPDGHICLLDIQHYNLKIISKSNIFYFNKFLIYLLEAMPVRLKEIHVFNCPIYYDRLYCLVKTVLPQYIRDLVRFHPNVESLHKEINKKYLPIELGGEAPSMKEQQAYWVNEIQNDRKMFLDENLWKADLKRKPKSAEVDLDDMNVSIIKLRIIKMALSYKQELVILKEWLAKEDYLPQNFGDDVLRKFLHSCYGSLEQTKRCIEKFCVDKCAMPEIYTNRDPLSARIQTAFSITCVCSLEAGKDEMLIHELDDPELEKFNFYDVMKSFTIMAEHWVSTSKMLPEGHICLLDIKHYFLKVIPKCDISLFRRFIVYLLEAMPVRIKEVHVYNCPSYYETLYALVKSIIPVEIRNKLHFHLTLDSLHKAVDKKYLPIELGGEAASMEEDYKKRVKEIQTSYQSKFQDETFWKANMSRRLKTDPSVNLMAGSFKTLDID
ncbi:hypothetical protein K1T71_009242 [Dendrolimus kikuchii]|uniref:Uncharacterized protein n=1 Tax=Dendrolimus kikuchii TaxID=765133 RepID=A0ACC1CU66_9NEOP|nr:hypothetical protein K1T71_009242 [Dendrolimus kikuchii]